MQEILHKYPSFEVKEVGNDLNALMFVQDAEEMAAIRSAAKATVTALLAGMHAIRPGVPQHVWGRLRRDTKKPTFSHGRSGDHGNLVRLDVGCEWQHYQGDLGRTVPVSGHYSDDQRETWNIFVAAYRAGVAALRAGITVDQVYEAWRVELLRHRTTVKSVLAQHAIDSWTKRENVPFWQIHTTNLVAAFPPPALPAGMTVNFEPIASVDGHILS